jgi:hypothetical protein
MVCSHGSYDGYKIGANKVAQWLREKYETNVGEQLRNRITDQKRARAVCNASQQAQTLVES